MRYREYGNTGEKISVIGLGGHEFHPDGRVKGFSDSPMAVTPGYTQEGFGGENRISIVKKALDLGINFFDLTIDPEKEAMGRILKDLKPSQEIFLQTRPEGMVYTYDPANKKMADYTLLKNEVVRILGLLQRERIDILNLAFMKAAVDADPEYIEKMGDNIRRLKQEGLIRFASADTFSGNALYIKQIESGYFDSLFINYNLREMQVEEHVMPKAKEKGMAMLAREPFMKGMLFKMAEEAGIEDRSHVAKLAVKWILRKPEMASVMVGVSSPAQLQEDAAIIEHLDMNESEQKSLEKILCTSSFKKESEERRKGFYKEVF